jgi:hypothetical protein
MSNQKSPYNFGGNGAGSLAQSISKIGEAFGGLRKEKQRLNDKMLDSEIRIRERAIADSLKSSLKKKEMKTAGKQERKTYKKQVSTNVKAAERLTGTEKGQGVVKGGSKVSFGRERMDFTAKDTSAPATPAKTSKPRTSAKPSTVKDTAKAVAKTAGKQLAATAKEGAVALGAAAGGAITKSPAGARAGAAVAQVAADAVEKGVKKAVANRKAATPATPKPTAKKVK